jgi:hypothetical protein
MNQLMSPFRFAGQWAMLPVIAGVAVVTGGLCGLLDAWATAERPTVDRWILELLQSPVLLVVAAAVIGLMTNSWTIATLTGALTLVTAELAAEGARWYWAGDFPLLHADVVLRLPGALLVGGALGLAGCLWHHESGYTRSIGAALLAGPLVWLSWRDLAPAGWPPDMVHVAGWIAGAAGLIVLLRCRGLGPLAIAVIGTVLAVATIDIIEAGDALDLRSTLTTLRDQWNQLVNRVEPEW